MESQEDTEIFEVLLFFPWILTPFVLSVKIKFVLVFLC